MPYLKVDRSDMVGVCRKGRWSSAGLFFLFFQVLYPYHVPMIAAIVAGKPMPKAVPSVILSDVDNPFDTIDEPVELGELVVGEVLVELLVAV